MSGLANAASARKYRRSTVSPGKSRLNTTGLANIRLWLLIAAMTLLTTAVLSASFITTAAQAQTDRGAVSNLSVSSPNPGELIAGWDASGETPTDYRVRYAPSDQDYLSFSEANTSERGSAYPTGTSHTVNNLTAGSSYKVQVRARYNGGEHADNPWSGPWTDQATVTIASPPPPPPTTTPDPTLRPSNRGWRRFGPAFDFYHHALQVLSMGNGKVDTPIYPAVCGPLGGHESLDLFNGRLSGTCPVPIGLVRPRRCAGRLQR